MLQRPVLPSIHGRVHAPEVLLERALRREELACDVWGGGPGTHPVDRDARKMLWELVQVMSQTPELAALTNTFSPLAHSPAS